MDFKYKKFPYDAQNKVFTDKKYALRPVIQIDFESPNGPFSYFVLIDSGADYCIFHARVGELLGLEIKSGKPLTFFGTSGQPQIAYFHHINFKIGGNDFSCYVGFSFDIEQLAYGILGQVGFFDKWRIKFEYDKENVEIKEIRAS